METLVKNYLSKVSGRLHSFQERYRSVVMQLESAPELGSRVNREFKKTINFTLGDVQHITAQIKTLSSDHLQEFQKKQAELDECLAILDSCINSLEANIAIGMFNREENILGLQFHNFLKSGQGPVIEQRFVVGIPVDRDFRSKPRLSNKA